MGSPQEHVAKVFRALAVLVTLPPALVLISPWAAKGAIEHKGQNAASTHTSCLILGHDEGHAADTSWAGELLRRGGCIQFLWLDWEGQKRLQNVLVLCACWMQLHAVYAQAHRLRKSIWLVHQWGQAGVRVECLSPTRTHRR
ncbi:hypothetical protein JB92DRAFT_3035558 [Gautieria morchelliformis]|nr:hypothetical protein JB92DRAFT_3035558 [Gautieria morchelliformis]